MKVGFLFLFFIGQMAFGFTNLKDSFFDYRPEIVDFSDDGIRENLVDGHLVTTSPLELKVGDIFIDVDGKALKVSKIHIKGNEVDIETQDVDIEEVLYFLEIPKQKVELQPKKNSLVGRSSSPHLTMSEKGMLSSCLPYEERDNTYSVVNIKEGKENYMDIPFKKEELSMTVEARLGSMRKADWKVWRSELDTNYIDCFYDVDMEMGSSFYVGDEQSINTRCSLGDRDGFYADLEIDSNIEGNMKGNLQGYGHLVYKGDIYSDLREIEEEVDDYYAGVGMEAKGSLRGRLDLNLGSKIGLKVLGVRLSEIDLRSQAYLTGTLEYKHTLFKDERNNYQQDVVKGGDVGGRFYTGLFKHKNMYMKTNPTEE